MSDPASDSPNFAGRGPATPLAVKLLLVPLVVAIVAAGVWFAGAVVSDDMKVAMGATAVWFGICFVASLLVVRARRDTLVPVLGTFLVAAALIGGWLGYESTVDDEVNEQVATGAPMGAAGESGAAAGGRDGESAGGAPAPSGNVELASGSFAALAHPAEGRAAVVKLESGERVLTLTDFETDPGPDLRVYLATDESASDFEDLGALKGNKGNQQYEIPRGVDIERYSTVLVWCRAFTVGFGKAPLEAS